jgi:hypothetical protein
MSKDRGQFDEEFVRLALAINEHLPGYIDSYFGPEDWSQEAKRAGKLALPELTDRTDQLAIHVSRVDGLDEQRRDFLARQITAMQMSLRLLTGEKVSLTEEVEALYDGPYGKMNPSSQMPINDWIKSFRERVLLKNAWKAGTSPLKFLWRK